MPVEIVFETDALTEDKERGIATGWLPGRLRPRGRTIAAAMCDAALRGYTSREAAAIPEVRSIQASRASLVLSFDSTGDD